MENIFMGGSSLRSLMVFWMATLVLSLRPFGAWSKELRPCPLENIKYRELREVALYLEQSIRRPPVCVQEASYNAALEEVLHLLDMATGGGEANIVESVTEVTEARLSPRRTIYVDAFLAVGSLISSGDFIRSACGQELLKGGDFVLALADSIVSLAPFALAAQETDLAIVAGGVTLVGLLTKLFILAHRLYYIDMSNSKQRRAFILNSCGLYFFHQKVVQLASLQNESFPDLKHRVNEAQRELDEILKQRDPSKLGPPERVDEIGKLEEDLREAQKRMNTLAPVFRGPSLVVGSSEEERQRFLLEAHGDENVLVIHPDARFACFLVKQWARESRQNGAFPANIVHGLNALLQEDQNLIEGNDPPEIHFLKKYRVQYFSEYLNDPELYHLERPSDCFHRAREWFQHMKMVLEFLNRHLNLRQRRANALEQYRTSPQYREWEVWHEQYEKQKRKLEELQLRLVQLDDFSEQGQQNELSEIFNSWRKSRDGLLGDAETTVSDIVIDWVTFDFDHEEDGPATVWLNYELQSSQIALGAYHDLKERIKKVRPQKLTDPQSKRMHCTRLKDAFLLWNQAKTHVLSAENYCQVFRPLVDDVLHPKVSDICYGEFTSSGRLRRRESPLYEQRQQVDRAQAGALHFKTYYELLGCENEKG